MLWMRKFYWEMSTKEAWPANEVKLNPTTVFIDCSAGKALVTNKQVSARNKHTNLKYRFVNLALSSKLLLLNHLAPSENPSDMLTKIFDLPTMTHLSQIIRLTKS